MSEAADPDWIAEVRAARWLADWQADPQAFARGLADCAPEGRASAWLAEVVGRHLQRHGVMAATAESCTGGGIAAALTDIAGSSAWLEGGLVTYSNAAKTRLLDVPAALLQHHGAVSQAVVEAMAQGACQRLAAGCAVAVSGVAGPGGGSQAKPVGTVWLAWQGLSAQRPTFSQCLHFGGDRSAVRQATVLVALLGLLLVAR